MGKKRKRPKAEAPGEQWKDEEVSRAAVPAGAGTRRALEERTKRKGKERRREGKERKGQGSLAGQWPGASNVAAHAGVRLGSSTSSGMQGITYRNTTTAAADGTDAPLLAHTTDHGVEQSSVEPPARTNPPRSVADVLLRPPRMTHLASTPNVS